MERDSWHIVMRLQDDWIIAPDIASRRLAAGVFLKHGRNVGLLAFDVPDTHAHSLVVCDRPRAGRFAHAVEVALRKCLRLPVPFEPARIRPVLDQHHLYSAFRYVLGNTPRHGVQTDPCREGSNLPDLLGLRPLGLYSAANVRQALPRMARSDLLGKLGIDHLGAGSHPQLLRASAEAVACVPDLKGSAGRVVQVRRAAVQVGLGLDMSTHWLADHFEVSRRTVQRAAGEAVDASLVRAVSLQIGLREQLGSVPTVFAL